MGRNCRLVTLGATILLHVLIHSSLGVLLIGIFCKYATLLALAAPYCPSSSQYLFVRTSDLPVHCLLQLQ